MLLKARKQAEEDRISGNINWVQGPYQQLLDQPEKYRGFQLVMCHALMEWLAEPMLLLEHLPQFMADKGWLSLTFYNQHSLIYRNLIRGNFNYLERNTQASDPATFVGQGEQGSLTPGNPLDTEAVISRMKELGLAVIAISGIRVFNDYVQVPRGGNSIAEEVVRMELKYSRLEPYCWLGRYIHLLCRKV